MSLRNPNTSVSNETRNLTITGRQTIPSGQITSTPVQRKGSLLFDSRTNFVYYSDGISWIKLATASSGGVPVCIEDADGDTKVCTDTDPATDSDTIFFETDGVERARISSTGVFMVGTTTPTPGKIAHFEGDIDVTGVIDPIGLQFSQQGVVPGSTNIPDKGMLYTSSASIGDFSNTLVFVDNADISHTMGDMLGTSGPVADNALIRFDGTSGKLLQDSGIVLDDTNVFNSTTSIGFTAVDDITLTSNTGNIILNTNAPNLTIIDGDLNVTGTTFTTNTETINVKDNCIYLNNGYITPVGKAGCLVINYLPSSNAANIAVGGFTTGVAATSNPTVAKANTFTFSAGDLVQISSANNIVNDGLFEVESDSGTLLTIRGIGTISRTVEFVQEQFTTDATVAGEVRQVSVFIIEGSSSGELVVKDGDNSSDVTITTPRPVVISSSSAGGTFSLVPIGGDEGPDLSFKGLTAGANISIVEGGSFLTISSTGGSAQDLQNVLTIGNATGGTDILLSTGDEIVGQTDILVRGEDTAGGIGGDLTIRGGNDSGAGDGGDVNILAGTSVSGTPGNINLTSEGNIFITAGPTYNVVISGNTVLPSSSVQTIDATSQVLLETISLDTASRIYLVESRVTARSGNNGATFFIKSTFERNAGTIVRQIGTSFREEALDIATSAWTVDILTGVANVQVRVTGVIATTIDWKVTTTYNVSD